MVLIRNCKIMKMSDSPRTIDTSKETPEKETHIDQQKESRKNLQTPNKPEATAKENSSEDWGPHKTYHQTRLKTSWTTKIAYTDNHLRLAHRQEKAPYHPP